MRIVFVDGPLKAPEPVEPVPVPIPMSQQVLRWVTRFCRQHNGEPIELSVDQVQMLQLLFDHPATPHIIEGALAPVLALSALMGPTMGAAHLTYVASFDEMWATASAELRAFLDRDERGNISYSGKWPILTA
jgi:hypothetical protein